MVNAILEGYSNGSSAFVALDNARSKLYQLESDVIDRMVEL